MYIINMLKKRQLNIVKNGNIQWKMLPNSTAQEKGYMKRNKPLTGYRKEEVPKE